MILRYHRPDFDDLPPQERTNLVVDACAHTNELLEALCKLVSFLEHGRAKVYGQGCAREALPSGCDFRRSANGYAPR